MKTIRLYNAITGEQQKTLIKCFEIDENVQLGTIIDFLEMASGYENNINRSLKPPGQNNDVRWLVLSVGKYVDLISFERTLTLNDHLHSASARSIAEAMRFCVLVNSDAVPDFIWNAPEQVLTVSPENMNRKFLADAVAKDTSTSKIPVEGQHSLKENTDQNKVSTAAEKRKFLDRQEGLNEFRIKAKMFFDLLAEVTTIVTENDLVKIESNHRNVLLRLTECLVATYKNFSQFILDHARFYFLLEPDYAEYEKILKEFRKLLDAIFARCVQISAQRHTVFPVEQLEKLAKCLESFYEFNEELRRQIDQNMPGHASKPKSDCLSENDLVNFKDKMRGLYEVLSLPNKWVEDGVQIYFNCTRITRDNIEQVLYFANTMEERKHIKASQIKQHCLESYVEDFIRTGDKHGRSGIKFVQEPSSIFSRISTYKMVPATIREKDVRLCYQYLKEITEEKNERDSPEYFLLVLKLIYALLRYDILPKVKEEYENKSMLGSAFSNKMEPALLIKLLDDAQNAKYRWRMIMETMSTIIKLNSSYFQESEYIKNIESILMPAANAISGYIHSAVKDEMIKIEERLSKDYQASKPSVMIVTPLNAPGTATSPAALALPSSVMSDPAVATTVTSEPALTSSKEIHNESNVVVTKSVSKNSASLLTTQSALFSASSSPGSSQARSFSPPRAAVKPKKDPKLHYSRKEAVCKLANHGEPTGRLRRP